MTNKTCQIILFTVIEQHTEIEKHHDGLNNIVLLEKHFTIV